jgi:hypothetical protein
MSTETKEPQPANGVMIITIKGTTYNGLFQNGIFTDGTITGQDSEKSGKFNEHEELHGRGKWTAGTNYWQGLFKNDKLIQGTRSRDSVIETGTFVDDVLHGQGKRISINYEKEGQFVKGRLVKGTKLNREQSSIWTGEWIDEGFSYFKGTVKFGDSGSEFTGHFQFSIGSIPYISGVYGVSKARFGPDMGKWSKSEVRVYIWTQHKALYNRGEICCSGYELIHGTGESYKEIKNSWQKLMETAETPEEKTD